MNVLKVGTVQPLLFGGYESGPRVVKSAAFLWWGSDVSFRSTRRRRREFGCFFSRNVRVVKSAVPSERREEGVKPRASVCRAREKPQAGLSTPALAATSEAVDARSPLLEVNEEKAAAVPPLKIS